MYRNRFVAVVIPAHNEEPHIGGVLDHIPPFVDLAVVVDDASTDGTGRVARSSNQPRVVVLTHESNRGVGAAIVSGYRLALDRGADVIALLGGDDQMDTSYLPALVDPVVEGDADFAKGNRFFSERSWLGMPRNRIFGNVALSFLTRLATGYWDVLDAQNGYTAISRDTLSRVPLGELETGYDFENRMLLQLSLLRARVLEVPIPARYGEETSGIRVVRDGLTIVRTLVGGFWKRTSTQYRGQRLSIPGVALGASILALGATFIGLIGAVLGVHVPWLAGAVGWCFLGGLAGLTIFFALDARSSQRRGEPERAGAAQLVR